MILGAMISLSLAGEARKGSPLRSTKLRVIWGILLMVRQRARSESDVEFCRPLRRGCTAPGWGEGRQGGGQVDRELSWGPPGAGSQARGVRVSVLLVCSGDRGGVTEKQARPDSSPLEGHTPQPNPETTNRRRKGLRFVPPARGRARGPGGGMDQMPPQPFGLPGGHPRSRPSWEGGGSRSPHRLENGRM